MIEITKNEAKYLREIFPNVKITTTKNKRYVKERKSILKKLPYNQSAIEALREMSHFYNTGSDLF